MKAVLALLLVVGGLGLVYTGYTGHLPGRPASTSGNQDPFAGVGDYTGPGSSNLQGAAIATGLAGTQQNPWAQTAANGVTSIFQSGAQGGGVAK